MGILEPTFSSADKQRFQSGILTLGGLLFAVVGFSAGSSLLGVFGLICFGVGSFATYTDFKKRGAAKRKVAEEAEIRAYQLRQARGEVPPPRQTR